MLGNIKAITLMFLVSCVNTHRLRKPTTVCSTYLVTSRSENIFCHSLPICCATTLLSDLKLPFNFRYPLFPVRKLLMVLSNRVQSIAKMVTTFSKETSSLKGEDRQYYVGRSLRLHRMARRLSQLQVADLLSKVIDNTTKIPKSYVCNVENGHKNISTDRLVDFCKVLSTTVESVLRIAEELAELENEKVNKSALYGEIESEIDAILNANGISRNSPSDAVIQDK